MGFLDAAYSVLSEKRQWMHAREVAQEVLDRAMFVSQAQDPVGSLAGGLRRATRTTSNRRGFVLHGPMVGLKEWGPEIPPPDTVTSPPLSGPPLPLTEEQILAVKKTMPVDQFEDLFGDLWRRYQERQRWRLVTQFSAQELLRIVRREVDRVQDFLLERSRQTPQPEVIANWIVFCYQLELYREGTALFRHIGPDQVGEALYVHLSKIARACERHLTG